MLVALGLILGRITLPELFIAVLAVFILWPLLRSLGGAGPKQQRAPVLGRMGFTEMSRSQAFGEDASALARGIENRAASFPSTWAAQGKSPIGQTILFEYSDEVELRPWPVVAFAVPGDLPEFEIFHVALLDRFFKHRPQPDAAAPVGPTDTIIKVGPLKVRAHFDAPQQQVVVEGNDGFAKKYAVWATDPAAVRPVLTQKLIDRLVEMDDANLHIRRWRKWLFIYRRRTTGVSPEEYPAFLDEAVQLARVVLP